MNPFKRKKIVQVDSAVYNMAGDIDLRPNFLQTVIFSHIATHNPNTIASSITNDYLNGPGVKLSNFASWAKSKGYNDEVGFIAGRLSAGNTVDDSILAGQLPHEPGTTVLVQTTEVGMADYYYWVLQRLADTNPAMLGEDFEADFIEDENTIYIYLNEVVIDSFQPVGFQSGSRYLYVSYNTSTGTADGPINLGPTVVLQDGEPWPDVTGWKHESHSEEVHNVNLLETIHTLITYSDGRPDEENTVQSLYPEQFTEIKDVYTLVDYLGGDGEVLKANKKYMTFIQSSATNTVTNTTSDTEDIGGGVLRTTTVTTTKEVLVPTRTYREDEQEIIVNSWTPLKYFIYRYGSSNPIIDAMFPTITDQGNYFPFIPIRRDNRFYSETYFPHIYEATKKAYKKAFDGELSEVVGVLEDNPSLRDIDHAFIVFGVSLNTKENASKKYIYNFFKTIIEDPNLTDYEDYIVFKEKFDLAHQSWLNWVEWRDQAAKPGDPDYMDEPVRLSYPTFKGSSIRITNVTGSGSPLYDMTIHWSYIVEQTGTGLLKPGAKKGELWFEVADSEEFPARQWVPGGGFFTVLRYTYDHVVLSWQVDENNWKRLVFGGLWHENNVYRGRTITISSVLALNDEEESGFIVPLHEDIFKTLSLVDRTQMSTACSYILLNCYKVRKQKWYQTSAFKFLLVAGSIFLTVLSLGTGVGLLGTAASVGAALGFSGLVAIIVGSIANALAAILLIYVIQVGSVALFGEKIGSIISAIVSVIAIHVGTSMATGRGAAAGFVDLMKPDKLIQLTNAAGSGYTQYLSISAQETLQRTQNLVSEYEATTEQLENMVRETFGMYGSILDPMAIIETRDSFLARTLMTGVDISNISITLIERFVEITLSTELQP